MLNKDEATADGTPPSDADPPSRGAVGDVRFAAYCGLASEIA